MWGPGSRGDTQLRRPHFLSVLVLCLLGRFSSTVVVLLQQAVLEVLGVEQSFVCPRPWPSSFEKYWGYTRLEPFGMVTYWETLKRQRSYFGLMFTLVNVFFFEIISKSLTGFCFSFLDCK